MSPDFLRNYLSFGPSRRLVSRSMESALPVLADGRLSQFVPLELLKTAEGIRTSHSDQPERAIRRSVRDGLDRARLWRGPVAAANLKTLNTVLAGTVETI